MQIDSNALMQDGVAMTSDPAAPGKSISVVDQLEGERNARKLWGLYKGVWPVVTLVALGLSVAATSVAFFLPQDLPSFLYASGKEVWVDHKWVGLFGSIFLHGGFFHLFFNCYWLWLFGRVLEVEIGRLRYILLIMGSAWITGTAEMAVSGNPGIGISGVLYAIFGFMLVNRKQVTGFAEVLPSRLATMFVLWLFICIGLHYSGALNVANGAHFAGFAFGCAAGAFGRQSTGRLVGVTVALSIAFSFPLFWAPWQEGWLVSKAYQRLKTKESVGDTYYLDRVLLKNPENTWAHFTKGQLYLYKKQYKEAKQSLITAAELANDRADIANAVGWLLSTCPDDTVRDGKLALRYAKKACDLTAWKSGAYLDTYAAALAETNDFPNALVWAAKAAAVSPEQKAIIEMHIEAFKAGRAWREVD